MTVLKHALRIFLSSPGDVASERDVVRQAIFAVSLDPLISDRIALDCLAWDTEGASVPISANQTPQDSVDAYVQPKDCDLTIVLLWSRMGTPMPSCKYRPDGSTFESGTAWEIDNAMSAGKPVWIYQKATKPQIDIDDPELTEKLLQYKTVKDYLGRARSADGSLRFGINSFENDEKLRGLITQHLRHFIKSSSLFVSASRTRRKISKETASVHPITSHTIISEIAKAASQLVANTKDANLPDGVPPLFELDRYPIGPMVRDVIVSALADSVAEIHYGEDLRSFFARLNTSLKNVTKTGEPTLRIPIAQFNTATGSRHFWADVFHYCAVQGPRALAALLKLIDPQSLDGKSLQEFRTLAERVNYYAA